MLDQYHLATGTVFEFHDVALVVLFDLHGHSPLQCGTTCKWTSPAGAGLQLFWNWTRNSTDCLPFHHGLLRRLVEVNLTVHIVDPVDRNEVMMSASFRIVLGQHDAIATFCMVDGSDMFTVRSNHFHVFLNVQTFEHVPLPLFSIKRLLRGSVPDLGLRRN